MKPKVSPTASFFQLAQKLHEEHESPSIVFIEDGDEENGLRGEERDAFEALLSLGNKKVVVEAIWHRRK